MYEANPKGSSPVTCGLAKNRRRDPRSATEQSSSDHQIIGKLGLSDGRANTTIVRRSATTVALRRYPGIRVWLATFAVSTVLSSSDDWANGSHYPHLHSLGDYLAGHRVNYLAEGILEDSLLGVTLCEDQCDLKSGASATGLLIVDVRQGSPAANAGLAARRRTPIGVISGIIVVGALAFPPAILLLPMVNSLPFELGGDLIIAADGSRVRNQLDYQNYMRDAQPGEIVYLTIVRRGVRKQVPVPIPEIGN
jgi:PDZ domain